ncbi:MAG: UDP-N-acetylglucosamine--N-acetylmuramyl-(pentapeptide) pyrophosphoryl-undecaprenol N-acetylglucosamine transferase [Candidatus Saccharimonadales bacterium]
MWFTGAHGYKKILHAVEKSSHKDNIIVEPYTNELATVFSAADVVITRAGATTLAELSIMKKPSVIIPNPLLTGGHQTMNARVYQQHNAAIVVTEKQLADAPLILSGVVKDVLMNQEKQLMLSDNISTFARVDAAKDIAHLLLAAGNRNSGV